MLLTTTRVSAAVAGTGRSRLDRSTPPCASLYSGYPTEEITLDEFELYALDR